MATRSQEIADKWRKAQDERRRLLEPKWTEISEYFCPERGRFSTTESTPDSYHGAREGKILDSTGQYAKQVCVNGIYSQLSSPTSKWFRLAFEDDALNDDTRAKQALGWVENQCYDNFRRSNWYSSIRALDEELLSFATACLFQGDSLSNTVHYRVFTAGEYWLAQNSFGKVDTVYRRIMWSADQLIKRFGKNKVSRQVRDVVDTNPFSTFEILHVVQPRQQYDPDKLDTLNMPFESVYLEVADDYSILGESGFKRFPYIAPRFLTVSNDVYGSASPGWNTLPDVKMLQEMEESKVRMIHKLVRPPMIGPTLLKGQGIKDFAGGVTWADNPQDNLKPLYQVQGQLGELIQEMGEVRQRILRDWYYDIFLMLQQLGAGPATATQVLEMAEEKKLQLGPLVSVHTDDILDPAVEYMVDWVINRPTIPDIVRRLQGLDYRIEYISPLAQAQRQQEARAIDATLAFTGNAAAIYPDIVDNFDYDEAWRRRADLMGIPVDLIKGQDVIKQVRAQRAQEMEMQKQAQMAMAAVQGAQQLSQTSTDPENPNALTDMARMAAGQQGAIGG